MRQAYAFHQRGRFDAAGALYREILSLEPNHADALHLLGVIEAQQERYDVAADLIARAAAAAPGNPFIHYNLGNVLRALGRLDDAVASYDLAVAIDPDNPSSLTNRGGVLHELKRPQHALADYERAIALDPNHAPALLNRGNTLLGLKLNDEAVKSYERCLALQPNQVHALFGRGRALASLLRFEEALASYTRTVALAPNHAEAHANRGDTLFQLGRYAEAAAAYEKATVVKSDYAAAFQGLGNALFKIGRGQEAAAAYDKAYRLDPDLDYIEGTRLLTKMYVCDWSDFEAERGRLLAHALQGKLAANPFAFLMIGETPAQQLQCARGYAAVKYPPAPLPLWWGDRAPHEKIRLGYVSGEFREQATGFLTADLFECHDRGAFELHAFSTGMDDGSTMRSRIKAAFDTFSDVSRRSDQEIAEFITREEIDILINLNGFFGEERTGLVAFKPAPIQVNYLGFPGTMGAPYMDYILADRWIIPEDQQQHYEEKIVYLPDTYQANDRKKVRPDTNRSRSEFGLPESGFVFCSFNNAYKITPDMFSVWMRLLKAVDGSVLWLLEVDSGIERNLRREAAARGVAPERILFAPFVKLKEHFSRGRLADLFLDTLPVNAHTTASDALWMGVPVLTCVGTTFAGRVAASLLSAIGLHELITHSLADYEQAALRLARDPGLISEMRAKLAANRETFPLFDTPRLTRHIETAYTIMWHRHESGLPPESFAVANES
jgi:predicted O-linked N-acetylglucosamine transferase (SPINDLY family)